jgi:uncharacterized protein (TIGR00369 family)
LSSPDDGRPEKLESSLLRDLIALMPFAGELGVVLDAAGPDEVSGRMAWKAERCTAGGILHGGALMAFADTLGAVCAFLSLSPGARTATILFIDEPGPLRPGGVSAGRGSPTPRMTAARWRIRRRRRRSCPTGTLAEATQGQFTLCLDEICIRCPRFFTGS